MTLPSSGAHRSTELASVLTGRSGPLETVKNVVFLSPHDDTSSLLVTQVTTQYTELGSAGHHHRGTLYITDSCGAKPKLPSSRSVASIGPGSNAGFHRPQQTPQDRVKGADLGGRAHSSLGPQEGLQCVTVVDRATKLTHKAPRPRTEPKAFNVA